MVNATVLHYLHHRSYGRSCASTKMEMLKFTPEQTENFTFPVGCPVWYFPNIGDDAKTAEGRNQYSIMPGTIESVTMDLKSMQINYHVEKDGKIIGGGPISEKELAFAFQCPVIISPEGDGEPIDGVVLQSRNGGTGQNGVVYTVMHDVPGGCKAYKDGIQASRVKYRKVAKDDDATPALKSSPLKSPEQKVTVARDVPSNVSAADDEVKNNQLSPITFDSAAKSAGSEIKDTSHGVSTPASTTLGRRSNKHTWIPPSKSPGEVLETQRKHRDHGEIVTPKAARGDNTSELRTVEAPAYSRESSLSRRESGLNVSLSSPPKRLKLYGDSIDIVLPMWLQKDRNSRQQLYWHLRGPKNDPHPQRILKETQCDMFIEWDEATNEPIKVLITHSAKGIHAQQFLVSARRRVENLLLAFQLPNLPPVGEDGSKGRCLYEVAKSCPGAHRPKGSKYGALSQRYSSDNKYSYMSMVELPYTTTSSGKSFHAHFLTIQHVIKKIQIHTGCSIMVCGTGGGITAKYCDPYVLIIGDQNWKAVDGAVELVNEEIRKHQSQCNCSMPK